MKKNAKTFFATAAVMVMAFALTFTACDDGSDDGDSETIVIVPGADLEAKFLWLKNNAKNFTDYTVQVNANETLTSKTLDADNLNGSSTIKITLVGITSERIVQLSGGSPLFTITNGYTLVLDDKINLKGGGSNGNLVVVDSGGVLYMENGASITNVTGGNVSSSGAVRVGGTFTMNGGEISGNTGSTLAGGVGVQSGGTFTMNNGTIKNNTLTASSSSAGGGVYVNSGGTFVMNNGTISGNKAIAGSIASFGGGVGADGTFTMNGGTISGNTSEYYGGGVSVNGTFTMNGGVISGNTGRYGGGVGVPYTGNFNKPATGGIIYGSDGDANANTVTGGATAGAAIFNYNTSSGYRNTTVTASEALTVVNGAKATGTWDE